MLFLPVLLYIPTIATCLSTMNSFPKIRHKLQFPKGGLAYAMLTTTLPLDLHEFTLCYWLRVNQLNKGSNTILSYAVENEDNEIRSFLEGHREAVYIGFYRKSMFVAKAKYRIHLGAWYHICNVWSAWNGEWEIYVNGQLEGNGTSVAQGFPVIQGGLIVLGQDQDKIGGGFAAKDSLTGELLDLNMWDESLNMETIRDLSTCLPLLGNIVAWLTSPFSLHGGTVVAPTQLCETFIRTRSECEKYGSTPNDQQSSNWGTPCWGSSC